MSPSPPVVTSALRARLGVRPRGLLSAALAVSVGVMGASAVARGGPPALRPASTAAARAPSARAAGKRDRKLLDTYREMLAEDPTQPYPLRRLLEVSHVVGGLPGLIQLYRDEVHAHPKRYAAWLVLGHLLAAAEEGDEALQAYAQAARVGPAKAAPHLAQAALYQSRLEWRRALEEYDRAVALSRGRQAKQDALKAAAEAALRGHLLERADAYYDALFKTEPRNLYLRMERAEALGRVGADRRAVEAWLELRERARGDLATFIIVCKELGPLQMQLGDLEAAETTWRQGLRRVPRGHWARGAMLDGLVSVYRRRDALGTLLTELAPQATQELLVALVVAGLHEELGQDDQALATLQAARRRWPRDPRVRRRLVALVERTGTPAEILDAYRALVRATPGEPRPALRLAELYLTQGHTAEGMKRLASLARRYREDPGVHRAIIDLIMRYGGPADRPRVEAEYRTLRKLEPREPAHIISLGEYYWSAGQRRRALDVWKDLLTLGPTKAEGWFSLAEVYADHKLAAEAAAAYERAIELAPGEERYVQAYALLLEQQRRYGPALDKWLRLLDTRRRRGARRPTPGRLTDARKHIVELWDRAGRLDAQMKRLGTLMDGTPPDLEAGRTLAVALQRRHALHDARRLLERITALAPQDVESLRQLERVLERLNEPRAAIALLERLAALDTHGGAQALRRAADLALGRGRTADTLRFMRRVVELDPANAKARVEVGDLYRRMGHLAEAGQAWRQALALNPRDQAVRLRLAALYRQRGQPRREARLLVELLEQARDPAVLTAAGHRLLALTMSAAAEGAEAPAAGLDELLRTLARGRPDRPIYQQLLVELYNGMARSIDRSDRPTPARRQALEMLGARALKTLLDALAGDDAGVRAAALRVLALTRPPGAAAALARLASVGDSSLSSRAIAALGALGGATATAALARAAAAGPSDRKMIALWALGLVGSPAAAATLADGLGRGRTAERAVAALALGMCKAPAGAAALRRLARDSPARRLRWSALWALAARADAAAVGAFSEALRRGQRRETDVAAWGLARVASPEARRALVRALWSPDRHVRVTAAAALAAAAAPPARSAPPDPRTPRIVRAYGAALDLERGRLRGSWTETLAQLADAPRAHPRPHPHPAAAVLSAAGDELAATLARRLGSGGDALEVLRGLDAGPPGHLGLAPIVPPGARLDPEEARALVALIAPVTPAIASLARTSPSPEVRALGLKVWARTLDTARRVKAVTLLAPEVRGPSLAAAAVEALGRWEGPEAAAAAWSLAWGVGAPTRARRAQVKEAVEEAVARWATADGSADAASRGPALAAAARAVGADAAAWRRLLGSAQAGTRAAAAAALPASMEGAGQAVLDLLDDDAPAVRAAALKAGLGMPPRWSERAARRALDTGDPSLERAVVIGHPPPERTAP